MTNKKISILLLLLVVILAVVFISAGKFTQRISPQPAPPATNSKRDATTPPPQPKTYTSAATVKQVNASDIQVEVAALITGSDGLSVYSKQAKTIHTDSKTKYFFITKSGAKKPAKFTDVKPNSQISINSLDNIAMKSDAIAISIDITQ